MLNNFLNEVNVSTKIIIMFFLIFTIFIVNSVFFDLFLLIIILIYMKKSVNKYLKIVFNLKTWLIFIFIVYIIIIKKITLGLVFTIDCLLIIIIFSIFIDNISFEQLDSGINKIIQKLSKFNLNVDNISYQITKCMFFIKYFMENNYKINKLKYSDGKLKYNLLSKLIISIEDVKQLDNSLIFQYYDIKKENFNVTSKICLFISIIIFSLILIKEVVM